MIKTTAKKWIYPLFAVVFYSKNRGDLLSFFKEHFVAYDKVDISNLYSRQKCYK